MTEATHFSQCVHDQQRRLEAEDCDSIRCAQLISGGRRRIRPPCSASLTLAHNALHSPSYYLAGVARFAAAAARCPRRLHSAPSHTHSLQSPTVAARPPDLARPHGTALNSAAEFTVAKLDDLLNWGRQVASRHHASVFREGVVTRG